MLDLSQYKLGETSPDIILESKEDNHWHDKRQEGGPGQNIPVSASRINQVRDLYCKNRVGG